MLMAIVVAATKKTFFLYQLENELLPKIEVWPDRIIFRGVEKRNRRDMESALGPWSDLDAAGIQGGVQRLSNFITPGPRMFD